MEVTADLLVTYGSMLCLALLPLYLGANMSLSTENEKESPTMKDAMMYPVIASVVLFGLFLVFNTFDKDLVNTILTAYFLLFGVLAMGSTLEHVVKGYFSEEKRKKRKFFFVDYTEVDIYCLLVSVVFGVWYLLGKHWIANNVMGLAFSVFGISLMNVTFPVGCILLWGLFVYDVFWVFGTDVMVKVATNFDAPVKLLFPKNLLSDDAVTEFGMLGLGDIVLPGIFLAFLLRFDAHRAGITKKTLHNAFDKSYFITGFIAYIVGLITTIAVMHTWQHAQPALLYLVPCCTGAPFLLALVRGEVALLVSYSDPEPEEDEDEKDEKDEKENENEKEKAENGDGTPNDTDNHNREKKDN